MEEGVLDQTGVFLWIWQWFLTMLWIGNGCGYDNGLRKCVTMLWIWFVSGQGFSFFFSGVLVFMATQAAIVR